MMRRFNYVVVVRALGQAPMWFSNSISISCCSAPSIIAITIK